MPTHNKDLQSAIDAALDARSILSFAANKFDVGGMTMSAFESELALAQGHIGISLRHLARFAAGENQTKLPV